MAQPIHSKVSRRAIDISSIGQDFSQKGDSGGPVIMEGGLAAGIILGHVGARRVDTHVHFNCSWVLPLTEIFPRIKIMTGREFGLMHFWELIEGCR